MGRWERGFCGRKGVNISVLGKLSKGKCLTDSGVYKSGVQRMSQTGHLSLRFIVYRESKSLSHVRLFATPWIVAHQAPLSMEFSRQEHWSKLSFPYPHCVVGDTRIILQKTLLESNFKFNIWRYNNVIQKIIILLRICCISHLSKCNYGSLRKRCQTSIRCAVLIICGRRER